MNYNAYKNYTNFVNPIRPRNNTLSQLSNNFVVTNTSKVNVPAINDPYKYIPKPDRYVPKMLPAHYSQEKRLESIKEEKKLLYQKIKENEEYEQKLLESTLINQNKESEKQQEFVKKQVIRLQTELEHKKDCERQLALKKQEELKDEKNNLVSKIHEYEEVILELQQKEVLDKLQLEKDKLEEKMKEIRESKKNDRILQKQKKEHERIIELEGKKIELEKEKLKDRESEELESIKKEKEQLEEILKHKQNQELWMQNKMREEEKLLKVKLLKEEEEINTEEVIINNKISKSRNKSIHSKINSISLEDLSEEDDIDLENIINTNSSKKSSRVRTVDNSRVSTVDNSRVSAGGNSRVSTGGNSRVSTGGNSRVSTGGNSRVSTGGNSRVSAGGNSRVSAGGNSRVSGTSQSFNNNNIDIDDTDTFSNIEYNQILTKLMKNMELKTNRNRSTIEINQLKEMKVACEKMLDLCTNGDRAEELEDNEHFRRDPTEPLLPNSINEDDDDIIDNDLENIQMQIHNIKNIMKDK